MRKYLLLFLIFSCSTKPKVKSEDLTDKSLWVIPLNSNVVFKNKKIILFPINRSKKPTLYDLVSKKKYKDFILTLEFYVDSPKNSNKNYFPRYYYGNSGITIRGSKSELFLTGKIAYIYGLHYEIDPSPRAFTGAMYDFTNQGYWIIPKYNYKSFNKQYYRPSEPSAIKFQNKFKNFYKSNSWNKVKILCQGSNVKFYLNGIKTAEINNLKYLNGFIALQCMGGPRSFQFKNILIKEF